MSLHVLTDESDESGSESERDVAVPKKRRKREAPPVPPRRMPSPEPQQEPSLSRSSSLLQFECLEQALSQEELEEEEEEEEEDDPMVFRTSATDKPFSSGESQPPSFSSFSFDSLDTSGSRRRCSSPLKDSLEDEELDETASSSPGCSSSSDDESYFLDRHHKLSGSLGRSRLRSYRSFDSLVHAMRPGRMPLSCVSLENAVLQEEEDENKTPSKKSSENLSEDSGFGEMSMRRQSAAQPIAEEDEEKVEPEEPGVNKEEPPALDKQQPPDVSADASSPHPAAAVAAAADEGEAVELNLEEFEEGQVAAGWGPPSRQQEPPHHHSQGHTHDTTTVLAAASCGADQWSDSHLVEFNSDLSVNEEPPPVPPPVCEFYCSAPSLLSEAPMSAVPMRPEPPAPAWNMHPPMEITEEVILKTTTSPDASPKTSKSNKFGSFFQRFSFRKSKGKKSPSKQSQEDIRTTEAIHSVEETAAELSNLDTQLLSSKRARAVPPPLPPVGPPKSRLLGIVGRRKAADNTAAQCAPLATPYADGGKQKIDIGISSNGGSKEISPRAAAAAGANKKASSLVNITAMNIVDIDISEPAPQGHHLSLSVARPSAAAANDPRAKSMEFLLDDENKAAVQVSHRFFPSFFIYFAAGAKPPVGIFPAAAFGAVFLLSFN